MESLSHSPEFRPPFSVFSLLRFFVDSGVIDGADVGIHVKLLRSGHGSDTTAMFRLDALGEDLPATVEIFRLLSRLPSAALGLPIDPGAVIHVLVRNRKLAVDCTPPVLFWLVQPQT